MHFCSFLSMKEAGCQVQSHSSKWLNGERDRTPQQLIDDMYSRYLVHLSECMRKFYILFAQRERYASTYTVHMVCALQCSIYPFVICTDSHRNVAAIYSGHLYMQMTTATTDDGLLFVCCVVIGLRRPCPHLFSPDRNLG